MRIRRLVISRYRGLKEFSIHPGARTILIGPNNTGKSTVLEALDLLLHPGLGRPRPSPTELDYHGRTTTQGFEIEAVLTDLSEEFTAECRDHFEGWNTVTEQVVPEPDGPHVIPAVRVRVVGSDDLDVAHEFAKPESAGARFGPKFRTLIGWVFDGRVRDPSRQLSFYRGGLLDRLFQPTDLGPAVDHLRGALGEGAGSVNEHESIDSVLSSLAGDLRDLGLLGSDLKPAFEVGAISQRELLQTLRLAIPADASIAVPLTRQGRGMQRLALVAVLLRLARAKAGASCIGGFEEPEEALEPIRQAQVAGMLRSVADAGGQVFVVTHSPEVVRAFNPEDLVVLEEPAKESSPRQLSKLLSVDLRKRYENKLDRSVVRALFAAVPVLVEGPTDRVVLEVFVSRLVAEKKMPPPALLGIEFISCEGWSEQDHMAGFLRAAGKRPAALVERDVNALDVLRDGKHCSALLLHARDRPNLESALAHAAEFEALVAGLEAVADDGKVEFNTQRAAVIAAAATGPPSIAARDATDLHGLFAALDLPQAEEVIGSLLANDNGPFSIKSPRPARLFADALVAAKGVPAPFEVLLDRLAKWAAAPSGEADETIEISIDEAEDAA